MILDIINKKRLGLELSFHELDVFFNGFLKGEVKDYQMSSLLMAICINGMTDEEIFSLTKIFIDSGAVLDFSDIDGIIVDKHSTGGIGDKTTLVVAPLVASLGVPVIKMSGRGLGITGGTIDKLESIPGYRIDLSSKEIFKQVNDIGIVLTGQSSELVPMDKVVYALRDVSGTVSSIPLIASSIMSKKIAGGADKIIIDIKVGDGALLNTVEEAHEAETIMKKIGEVYGKEVKCIISDMNVPLGKCVGNSLEVLEAVDVLKGKEKDNSFVDLCINLASYMVSMGKNISFENAKELVKQSLDDKSAYNKFLQLVKAQGGDIDGIEVSRNIKRVRAKNSGTLKNIDALELGKLSLELGAGKKNIDDKIDYTVGIKLNKLCGDIVKRGDILAFIYVGDHDVAVNYEKIFTIK